MWFASRWDLSDVYSLWMVTDECTRRIVWVQLQAALVREIGPPSCIFRVRQEFLVLHVSTLVLFVPHTCDWGGRRSQIGNTSTPEF